MNEITGYEVREDILEDGVSIFDVYQLYDDGTRECVDSHYDKDEAIRHARICAKDDGMGSCEIKVYRK